jgi:hypothetical protein
VEGSAQCSSHEVLVEGTVLKLVDAISGATVSETVGYGLPCRLLEDYRRRISCWVAVLRYEPDVLRIVLGVAEDFRHERGHFVTPAMRYD